MERGLTANALRILDLRVPAVAQLRARTKDREHVSEGTTNARSRTLPAAAQATKRLSSARSKMTSDSASTRRRENSKKQNKSQSVKGNEQGQTTGAVGPHNGLSLVLASTQPTNTNVATSTAVSARRLAALKPETPLAKAKVDDWIMRAERASRFRGDITGKWDGEMESGSDAALNDEDKSVVWSASAKPPQSVASGYTGLSYSSGTSLQTFSVDPNAAHDDQTSVVSASSKAPRSVASYSSGTSLQTFSEQCLERSQSRASALLSNRGPSSSGTRIPSTRGNGPRQASRMSSKPPTSTKSQARQLARLEEILHEERRRRQRAEREIADLQVPITICHNCSTPGPHARLSARAGAFDWLLTLVITNCTCHGVDPHAVQAGVSITCRITDPRAA